MAKKLNKRYKNLDARIKSWEQTIKTVKYPQAYRKPGSMKGRS